MKSLVDNKKMGIIILVVLILVVSAVVFFLLKSQMDDEVRKVELDNGDDIILNQSGVKTETIAAQPFDEDYVILSEKKFTRDVSGRAAGNNKADLPEGTKNLHHCYQMTSDGARKSAGAYDEIYQWETDIYRDAQAKVCPLQRNSGYRYKTADRGYMELSLYKEQPQRIRLGDTFKSVNAVKCFVNGKKASVTEGTVSGINSERKFYTAQFQDIDGSGTGAYLTADNVDSDYFIAVLENLAGRDYPLPEKVGGSQEGKADSDKEFSLAREEIAFRNAAEKMVYDRRKAEIKKHRGADFSIVATYYGKTKKQDGKKYNASCEYYIKGVGIENWYMFLEKKNGRPVEVGKTLVEPME